MTPEKAFLIRVFTKYCVTQKEEAQLEGKLPVVTGFAFKIQDVYNNLRQRIESNMNLEDDEDTLTSREEARLDLEFVLGEMLRIAMYLDYGDEMGRRRMFQLVSAYARDRYILPILIFAAEDMISQESLPSELAPRCLDVLRKLTPNERELIRIVVEVVQDLRDLKEPDGEEDQVRA
jgi:condensin complex subunit 3